VIDPHSQAVLQDVVRRESRSLLSYIGDAFPWTTAAGGPALASLRQAVRDEGAAVTALGRFLVRHHAGLPYLGSYPASFTSWNFVALDFLLPRLVEEERRTIAELEAALPPLAEAVRGPVQALLAVKRRNLETLQALAARPVPA
jgi:hypothetical protein